MFTFNSSDIVGTIKGYNGATPPSGWLFCDGSAVSRTTYADLFAVIGTNYGAGDGTTTFNLPNWQSVVSDVTIPSTITVCGNGKTLGLTNGGTWYGVSFGTNNSWAVRLSTWQSGGAAVGSSVSETSTTVNKALGIIEDVQSGLIAKSNSITRSAFNSKFIIKFQ